jgi:hypothetical protein
MSAQDGELPIRLGADKEELPGLIGREGEREALLAQPGSKLPGRGDLELRRSGCDAHRQEQAFNFLEKQSRS